MRILSVNVGLPRLVEWAGGTVSTAIYKAPVDGPVFLRRLNLDGDRQGDLRVHGGARKAVYAFASENYPCWRGELPGADLSPGAFGENLTTEGLDEEAVAIGDRFRIGAAIVQVTQPRIPCYKLGIRLGAADVVARFLATARVGFYLAVLGEGGLEAGDPFIPLGRESVRLSVADATRLYAGLSADPELLRRAAEHPILPASWRERFALRLQALERVSR